MPQAITEEQHLHDQWYIDAMQQTEASLPEFVRHLSHDYEHDHGTICHAVTAAAIAAAHVVDDSPSGGITGFQAGCIMWEFIRHWMHEEGPLRLLHYEHMLYPQYERDFSKTISQRTADWLLEEAKKKLATDGPDATPEAHPDIIAHWQSIVAGNVPFGFTVEPD